MPSARWKNDWDLVIGGVALLVIGLVCLFYPGMTLAILAMLVGVGFLVAGAASLISYLRLRTYLLPVRWTLGYAIVDVVIGLVFLLHPLAVQAVLPWLCGLFVLLLGAYEMVAALGLRAVAVDAWRWAFASSLISILMALIFFFVPQILAILIGLFAVMQGISFIVYGYSFSSSELMR